MHGRARGNPPPSVSHSFVNWMPSTKKWSARWRWPEVSAVKTNLIRFIRKYVKLFLIYVYSLKLPDRYEAEEASDVSARRRALVSMQRALIKGQEIGDEKLQVLKPRGDGGEGGGGIG